MPHKCIDSLKTIKIIGISLVLTSCSLFYDRRPAGERETLLAQIYSDVALAENTIGVNSLECKRVYQDLYQRLFDIAGESAYFESSELAGLDSDIKLSFETRILLKDSFKKFSLNNSLDRECLDNAQDVFKALRYVEDYLVELKMEKMASAPIEYVNLKGEFPYLLVNPKFSSEFKSYEDLKSGDVILSRGNAYTSAAIARITRSDYQFSHLSFVYKDTKTQELYTTEARIEIGSTANPFSDHLNEKNIRSAVFRYSQAEVARKASQKMFDLIKKQQETGKTIEYDFSMNYRDNSKYFCSEIISHGFKLADPSLDYLPQFKSQFSKGMIPFLNTLGVPVHSGNIDTLDIFAPGDIQFDPRFELVAEWRNPKKLEESRLKDFILTKLFERMDQHNYRVDPSVKMDAQSRVFWLLRRTPLVKKFLEKKFALNMSPAQMELFMALDKIGDAFYKNLELRSIEYAHPMTPKEIYTAIDDYLNKDYEVYQKYKKDQELPKPEFHLLFHP
ncbi:MAG: hypothetical protein KBD76_05475 [Bacteriovorax sp.]|nr:hypothetical protein [Bacteriovorax sp.]